MVKYLQTSSAMKEINSAAPYIPPHADYDDLKRAAALCQGCDLYKNATQTVFGEGTLHSPLFFVGEQPGDKEDLAGHPFVGPAGRLFRKALDEAKIDLDDIYITNAVK